MALEVLKWNKELGIWEYPVAGVDKIDLSYVETASFTDLSGVPNNYTGDALKVVRVNAGETGLEFATIAGGGDLLAANNLSDLANAATARTNIGLNTTANQSDSANKRFVTDAQLTVIGNTSGTNTGDSSTPAETTTTIGNMITGATSKATPVDADSLALSDSATSDILKKLTWANLKATVKTYFDTLYAAITHTHAQADITNLVTDLSNKQPLDSDLTTLAGLTATTDNFIQAKASAWASRTVAQVKTDLGLSGTNSGDQTSIVGITGTKAQFDTAVSDGNIMYIGDAPTAHTHSESDITNLVTDLAAKQATLVSGTNIKTVNGSSVLGAGNLVVSASITQTEVDFGSTPLAEQIFTISDAAAIVGSKIVASLAYDAPTSKDLDELDMDDIIIKCGNATTGAFSMMIRSSDGSYLADKFKINYIIA